MEYYNNVVDKLIEDGTDSVTVTKGAFSSTTRANRMCKLHPELYVIEDEVRKFYEDCFSNTKEEDTKTILTKFGVFTLIWKCKWYNLTNEIHTPALHRPLNVKEAAHFEKIEKEEKKLINMNKN